MSKPWKGPYLGLEWAHPARAHYREVHNGVDPWFHGATVYRFAVGLLLGVLGCIYLSEPFLGESVVATIAVGIGFATFSFWVLGVRDDEFERSIREVEGFLRLNNNERFATMGWGVLQELARADLKTQIQLWHTQVLRCANAHPLHGTAEDAEVYRQGIKRRYHLFASLGLIPDVLSDDGQDMLYSMSYIGHANAVRAATWLSPVC